MAITRIQSTSAVVPYAGPYTLQLTLSAPPSPGNTLLLYAGHAWLSPIVTALSMSGVTWTKEYTKEYETPGSYGTSIELWSARNLSSGLGTVIDITVTDFWSYSSVLYLVEYSGLAASGVLIDQYASAEGDDTVRPVTSGTTGTTTKDNQLWIGAVANYNSYTGGNEQSAPTNGFTQIFSDGDATDSDGVWLGVYEKIVSATGTAGFSVTLEDTFPSDAWTGSIATISSSTVALEQSLDVLVTDAVGPVLEPNEPKQDPLVTAADLSTIQHPNGVKSYTVNFESLGVGPGDILELYEGPNRGHYIIVQVQQNTVWVNEAFPFPNTELMAGEVRAAVDVAAHPRAAMVLDQPLFVGSSRVWSLIDILID